MRKRSSRRRLLSDLDRAKAIITRHEGCFRIPHIRCRDSEPIPVNCGMVIGVGRDLSFGLSDDEADLMLSNDICRIVAQLDAAIPWWRKMVPERQTALIALAHHSGTPYLLRLKRMLAAMERGLYSKASNHVIKAARYRDSDISKTAAYMICYGYWPKWVNHQ